jgi:hypothetical protein
MAEQKTKPTDASVADFLDKVPDPLRRADGQRLLAIMQEVTGLKPRLWGPSMIGFGEVHYVYASGHEGDTFRVGFSPRKAALSLYFMCCLDARFAALIKKLGKYTMGKACVYVKKLDDINLAVLRDMIRLNMTHVPAATKLAAKPRRKKV